MVSTRASSRLSAPLHPAPRRLHARQLAALPRVPRRVAYAIVVVVHNVELRVVNQQRIPCASDAVNRVVVPACRLSADAAVEVEELDSTERGVGGFGSTGVSEDVNKKPKL